MYDMLYEAFDLFNSYYFDNKLEKPFITLQKKRNNNYGYFVVDKTWFNQNNNEERYEININPINCDRNPEEILGTLLHEMVHMYCTLNEIKDMKGSKHTEEFANQCSKFGLNCEYDEKYGWAYTELNKESTEMIKGFIEEHKNDFWYMEETERPKPKKTQFKYVCKSCGLVVHTKPEKSIVCGECGCELEMEEEKGED